MACPFCGVELVSIEPQTHTPMSPREFPAGPVTFTQQCPRCKLLFPKDFKRVG